MPDWKMHTDDGVLIRPTVRILLLDLDDHALLFCSADGSGNRFWFTPGGGAHPGESVEETAHRELFEETGLTGVALDAEIWRRTARRDFEGAFREIRERWFLARVAHFDPDTSGFDQLEQDTIQEHRWWSAQELAETGDRLVPPNLPTLLTELLRDGLPNAPREITPVP